MPAPSELWRLPFERTALLELVLLALGAGLVGAWVVLRRRAFFAHAVGAATFPGLVAAAAAAFSAQLAALGLALAYAGGVAGIGRSRGSRAERAGSGTEGQLATALLLVAALAAGVVLASDVFESGAEVDRLLFGTLLGLSDGDVAFAGAAAVIAIAATLVMSRTWAAIGFDGAAGVPLPLAPRLADTLLLALIALVAVAALPAVGALLATALLIVPAATARLFAERLRTLLIATPLLAAAEAVAGLYLAIWLDAPPGPALAVLSSTIYLAAAVGRAVRAAARPGGPMSLARESPLFISPVARDIGPAGRAPEGMP